MEIWGENSEIDGEGPRSMVLCITMCPGAVHRLVFSLSVTGIRESAELGSLLALITQGHLQTERRFRKMQFNLRSAP